MSHTRQVPKSGKFSKKVAGKVAEIVLKKADMGHLGSKDDVLWMLAEIASGDDVLWEKFESVEEAVDSLPGDLRTRVRDIFEQVCPSHVTHVNLDKFEHEGSVEITPASYTPRLDETPVAVSNYELLTRDGFASDVATGSYNAAGWTFDDLISMSEATFQEVVSTIAALEDYPALDDMAVSEAEHEMFVEDWDNWIGSEFRGSVEGAVEGWAEEQDLDETQWDDLLGSLEDWLYAVTAEEFFRKLMDVGGQMVIESGGAYIDGLDKVVSAYVDDFLNEYKRS